MNVMNTHAVLSYASQLVVDEASTRFLQHMVRELLTRMTRFHRAIYRFVFSTPRDCFRRLAEIRIHYIYGQYRLKIMSFKFVALSLTYKHSKRF